MTETSKNFFYKKHLQKLSSEEFYNKGVLRKFAKFTGKHLCQSFFFNKESPLDKKRATVLENSMNITTMHILRTLWVHSDFNLISNSAVQAQCVAASVNNTSHPRGIARVPQV